MIESSANCFKQSIIVIVTINLFHIVKRNPAIVAGFKKGKADGRPYIRSFLLVGGDDAGHHIESVLEQVPHYQRRSADAVSVNDFWRSIELEYSDTVRRPCGGYRERRKNRRHQ